MLFHKDIVKNSRNAEMQWAEVNERRRNASLQEQGFIKNGQLTANEGAIPQDTYKSFDPVIVDEFRADRGDAFLNLLMPLSRSVNIGKLVHFSTSKTGAGLPQTSMSGQIGVKMDDIEYNQNAGAIIPIHDAGFERNFRQRAAMLSEGFDDLVDSQIAVTRKLREHLVDSFLDGFTDWDGNYIVQDGVSYQGMRNDVRVNQIDLGAGGVNFDFTDQTQTGEAIEQAFKVIRDTMHITNNIGTDLTYFVSREIASNMERKFSAQYDASSIGDRLGGLMGVANFVVTSKLTGNQIMGFPLNGDVRPVVGMALNTVQNPRVLYNDNYRFITWGAIGFEFRTDANNISPAFYAAG